MADYDEVKVPALDLLGPVMQSLTARQRRFVVALTIWPTDQQRAYAAAGYECTNPNSLHASASRLINSEPIKKAIQEETWRRLDSSVLMAASTLVELAQGKGPLSDPKIRLRAAEAILNRTGFNEKTEHHVVVEDSRTPEQLLSFIRDRLNSVSVEDRKLIEQKIATIVPNNIVDADYEVVHDPGAPTSDGLEDLL